MKDNREKDKRIFGKIRSVAIVIALDVAFAFGSYWAARAIMFYRAPAPENYTNYEWVAMLAMVIVTIGLAISTDSFLLNAIFTSLVKMDKTELETVLNF